MQSDGGETMSTAASSRSISAITIPTRRGSIYGNGRGHERPNFLVGSPDQLPDPGSHPNLPSAQSALYPSSSASAVGRRPSLMTRSISTPHSMSTARRRAGTVSLFNRASGRGAREQQWSLFGQIMEQEGQLLTPGRSSKRTLRDDHLTAPATPFECRDGPFPTESALQSPIQDEAMFAHLAARRPVSPSEAGLSDDSDTESDSEDSSATLRPSDEPPKKPMWTRLNDRIQAIPVLYRNIFKCAVAYFIASLFTYSPYLSDLISDISTYDTDDIKPLPSGHMVATVAVYFHPAKTMGAMVEADMFFFFGVFYAAAVSLTAMGVYWWLELQPGLEWLGDVLVILWVGICMSLLAFAKVRMANPQFGTACSMISIIIFVVIVKEGGLQTLLQTTLIVLCGCGASNVVCYLIWPQAATGNLQTNMVKTLDSFCTLLKLITGTFLLEEGPHVPSLEKIQRAIENHQNTFTGLKKNLSEAKREWYFRSDEAYQDAIDSLNRLAQHLNGLRSGTRLQYDLAKAGLHRVGSSRKSIMMMDEESAMLRAAAEMFGDLVDDLGPPLNALTTTCVSSLKHLRDAFVLSQQSKKRRRDSTKPPEFSKLVLDIERSLLRFESTSNHAVLRLYRKRTASASNSVESLTLDGGDNSLLVNTAEHEHVFLVYFFIFTLQEFSRELVGLVDAMERIYNLEQQKSGWFSRMKRRILDRWRARRTATPGKGRGSLRRQLSSYISQSVASHRVRPMFPKVRPHAPNTVQTPSRSDLSFYGRAKQMLWTIGHRLTERDAKHAIKTGMATAILAAPAFFQATRPVFVEYWGDWALITFFVVMSPTIGATNFLAMHRVVGTIFGAIVAAGVYSLFPENPAALAVFGFFFCMPCFYYIVSKPRYASGGRFVLLTYNLTCLYSYNIRERGLPVVYIAYHRAIAVTVGVVWAAFVSRFWWPSEARRELSKVLSEFCLQMGWLYTRLVAANSFATEDERIEEEEPEPTEETRLISPAHKKLHSSIQDFMAMELHLQIKLIELQGLLAQTQHEPRLKGPFPIQLYRGVLTKLQSILDRLHSMRCVTTREEWYTSVRDDFILPVNLERREMVGNIILFFSLLSAAFRLKSPLPPFLPPAERSRQKLVEAIRKLDVVKNREVKGSRQLLFFAYAITMKGVTEELESLGRTLQVAFGVIGGSPDTFEALFVAGNGSRRIENPV